MASRKLTQTAKRSCGEGEVALWWTDACFFEAFTRQLWSFWL